MVLWVDKYRPTQLDKLDLHPKITVMLRKMLTGNEFPHLMLYGPSGAGKSTRVSCLLKALYGPGADKVRVTPKIFKVGSRTIEINTIGSNYHIEVNPSDVGNADRYVIQEVISEIAQTQNVQSVGQQDKNDNSSSSSSSSTTNKPTFKVVVIREVDRLSKGAQQALRRTMEKYVSTCRLILVCESACRVIGPLRSRVLPIRIAAPTAQEISGVLTHIASKENITLPPEFSKAISEKCKRNLRRAILMLEGAKVQQYPFLPDQDVRVADWELFIDDLGRMIAEEQSPKRLSLARNKMYELLTNCIPPEVIIKNLTEVLLKRVDDQLKHTIIRWSAFYEHRIQQGSKPMFHLEAFVARFMSIYKRWVVESFG